MKQKLIDEFVARYPLMFDSDQWFWKLQLTVLLSQYEYTLKKRPMNLLKLYRLYRWRKSLLPGQLVIIKTSVNDLCLANFDMHLLNGYSLVTFSEDEFDRVKTNQIFPK